MSYTIHIEGAKFFAYHGYYPAERLVGADFEVFLKVDIESELNEADNLDGVVNYEVLYEIIQSNMKFPQKLLETLMHKIIEEIHRQFSEVKLIYILVNKLSPPLSGTVSSTSVSCTKSYKK
jgi:dihydroneopterin aldolase